jgi:hypothetical protein
VAESLKMNCEYAFAEYPDVSLHYSVSGSGPRSLVLIHELAGTLESFERCGQVGSATEAHEKSPKLSFGAQIEQPSV